MQNYYLNFSIFASPQLVIYIMNEISAAGDLVSIVYIIRFKMVFRLSRYIAKLN